MELFTVCSGEEQHFCYPNGDEVHIVDTVYVSNDFSGQMVLKKAKFWMHNGLHLTNCQQILCLQQEHRS